MSSFLNRRDWLKSGLLASVGITLGRPSLAKTVKPNTIGLFDVYAERELELAQEAALMNAPQIKARLSANENPWGPAPTAIKAITDSAPTAFLYAGSVMNELRRTIADLNGVSADQVLLGAGSSELLMASLLMAAAKGNTMMAETCYISDRNTRGEDTSMPFVKIPLTKEYQYDLDAMATRVDAKTAMIYMCNPQQSYWCDATFAQIKRLLRCRFF